MKQIHVGVRTASFVKLYVTARQEGSTINNLRPPNPHLEPLPSIIFLEIIFIPLICSNSIKPRGYFLFSVKRIAACILTQGRNFLGSIYFILDIYGPVLTA